jgi:hypothetical protein
MVLGSKTWSSLAPWTVYVFVSHGVLAHSTMPFSSFFLLRRSYVQLYDALVLAHSIAGAIVSTHPCASRMDTWYELSPLPPLAKESVVMKMAIRVASADLSMRFALNRMA